VRAIAKLLGASSAVVVLLVGASGMAQDAAKKPVTKSACNAITEETACKANTSCRWIAAIMDEKTGKPKRKAYCRTQGASVKKSTTPAK